MYKINGLCADVAWFPAVSLVGRSQTSWTQEFAPNRRRAIPDTAAHLITKLLINNAGVFAT